MSNILIYGYGAEGKSTEKFFSQQAEVQVEIFDEKTHPQKPNWNNFETIFLSPGIAPNKVPKAHQDKITNQINWFLEHITPSQRNKVIGITGSKGKTTTTLMTTHWLKNQGLKVVSAGNIGQPVLNYFDAFRSDQYDFIVLEISSFQAEIMRLSPGISIFLGLFSDHLDRHGNLKNYAEAKSHLWKFQTPDQYLITTSKGAETLKDFPAPGKVHISQALPKNLFPELHVFRATHFRENLGALKSLSVIIKKPFDQIHFTEIVEGLAMPEHRLEYVDTKNGIRYFNDAIASNPEAVVAAVKFFKASLGSLILGGTDSGGEFDILMHTIAKDAPQTHIVLTNSPISPKVRNALKKHPELELTEVKNLDEAVAVSQKKLTANQVCLLSPGGKSFDQFPNYTIKGQYFKKLVNDL